MLLFRTARGRFPLVRGHLFNKGVNAKILIFGTLALSLAAALPAFAANGTAQRAGVPHNSGYVDD